MLDFIIAATPGLAALGYGFFLGNGYRAMQNEDYPKAFTSLGAMVFFGIIFGNSI